MDRPNAPAPISVELQEFLLANFDHKFYAEEYYDLQLSPKDLFAHFILIGIHEGRSPNPYFDVSEYLASNRDVLLSGMNPIIHYVMHGKKEGRPVSQTIRIKQRLSVLEEENEIDWIRIISSLLDTEHYRKQIELLLPELSNIPVNYAVHYGLIGWKLGFDPSPDFSTAEWLSNHPDLAMLKLNPLLLDNIDSIMQLESQLEVTNLAMEPAVIDEPIKEPEPQSETQGEPAYPPINEGNKTTPVTDESSHPFIVHRLFDPEYYLATYTDVRDAGVAPLYHYLNAGWREGRNPSDKFSTSFYLSTYEDAANSGMDPLTHYSTKGRSKGYLCKQPGGWKVEISEKAISPEVREKDYQPYKNPKITQQALKIALLGKAATRKDKSTARFILAVSHDSYSVVTGGTQIFIADEMTNAAKRRLVHLHLAPATPGLTIGRKGKPTDVLVTVAGKALGIINAGKVFEILGTITPENVTVSIHSLIGYGAEFLTLLLPVAKKHKTFYWLHDYSILCNGYNLLRNDTTFCGGPTPKSVACTVCAYGMERAKRQNTVKSWVAEAKPTLLSPSTAALDVFNNSNAPPQFRQSLAIPHWSLSQSAAKKRTPHLPLRIAFVGYTTASKGWPLYNEIVNTLSESKQASFFHFIKGGSCPNPKVKGIDCNVTKKDRLATSTLLKKHKIDVVMILSPWPETFSYVAAESLMAGCAIVCLENSGNVRALVKSNNQGVIFSDDEALMDSIKQGEFIAMLKKATKSAHFHNMKQNDGIFEAMTLTAQAG